MGKEIGDGRDGHGTGERGDRQVEDQTGGAQTERRAGKRKERGRGRDRRGKRGAGQVRKEGQGKREKRGAEEKIPPLAEVAVELLPLVTSRGSGRKRRVGAGCTQRCDASGGEGGGCLQNCTLVHYGCGTCRRGKRGARETVGLLR